MSMSQRQRDLLYRLSARHILEDLEAQSPRRTQSWGANSLHSSQPPYDDNVHANDEDEFEVKYDDGVTQIRVRVDNKQSDSSNKKAAGGGGRCKTSHFIILLTPLAIAAIIAGSLLLFGPNSRRNNKPNDENDRTINAGNDMEDSINNSSGEDEVTGVLIPTLAPTMNATTGIVESVTVYTVNETSSTYPPTVAPITDAPTLFVSTSPTVADIVDIITTTEATTSSISTTEATGDFTTEEVVLVDGSMSSNNETALIEEEVKETTTTTTTIAAALETTTTTVAAIPAHLCTNIPSGKIFKIDITPKSSTTSLELFQLQNGEYKLVTAYPTVDDDVQELSSGENYIKKLCVLPGAYKFVVKESNGACYEGFFRGNSIFENCGNGEHDFEWVGSTASATTSEITTEEDI